MSDFDDFLKEVDSILGKPSPKKEENKQPIIKVDQKKKNDNFNIDDVKIKKKTINLFDRRNMMIY